MSTHEFGILWSTSSEISDNIFKYKVEKDDPLWKQYVEKAALFDERMVDQWNKIVDVLLVYVGISGSISFFSDMSRCLSLIWHRLRYSFPSWPPLSLIPLRNFNAIQPISPMISSLRSIYSWQLNLTTSRFLLLILKPIFIRMKPTTDTPLAAMYSSILVYHCASLYRWWLWRPGCGWSIIPMTLSQLDHHTRERWSAKKYTTAFWHGEWGPW